MRIDDHEIAFKEHLDSLNKAIEEGIEANQRNIGYNISQGSVELFAIYLHKLRLLQDSGDQFDHRIFKNKFLIDKKIPPEFLDRNKILEIMRFIELNRNVICYSKNRKLHPLGWSKLLTFNSLTHKNEACFKPHPLGCGGHRFSDYTNV